jgi:hypothetical protein
MKLKDLLQENELPMDFDSRMKRAEAMGFDTSKVYYHGTNKDIEEFMNTVTDRFDEFLPSGEKRAGYYFTLQHSDASWYAKGAATKTGGATVYPVLLRIQNPYRATVGEFNYYVTENDKKELKKKGHDAVVVHADYGEVMAVVFEKNQIRSIFARFDPSKSSSGRISENLK